MATLLNYPVLGALPMAAPVPTANAAGTNYTWPGPSVVSGVAEKRETNIGQWFPSSSTSRGG